MFHQLHVVYIFFKQLSRVNHIFFLSLQEMLKQNTHHSFLAGLTDEQRTGQAEDKGVDHHENWIVRSPDHAHLKSCSHEKFEEKSHQPRRSQK